MGNVLFQKANQAMQGVADASECVPRVSQDFQLSLARMDAVAQGAKHQLDYASAEFHGFLGVATSSINGFSAIATRVGATTEQLLRGVLLCVLVATVVLLRTSVTHSMLIYILDGVLAFLSVHFVVGIISFHQVATSQGRHRGVAERLSASHRTISHHTPDAGDHRHSDHDMTMAVSEPSTGVQITDLATMNTTVPSSSQHAVVRTVPVMPAADQSTVLIEKPVPAPRSPIVDNRPVSMQWLDAGHPVAFRTVGGSNCAFVTSSGTTWIPRHVRGNVYAFRSQANDHWLSVTRGGARVELKPQCQGLELFEVTFQPDRRVKLFHFASKRFLAAKNGSPAFKAVGRSDRTSVFAVLQRRR